MSSTWRTLIVFALPLAAALYEDQAGKVDWYRQQIGRAKHALFHSAGQAQRLALVATEPGVVAGLDLRTGSISWRSVLPDGEEIAVLEPHGKSLLSVSVGKTGAFVRLWGMTGGLTWDAHIPRAATPPGTPVAPPVALLSGSSTVVVAWQTGVRAFHTASGELLWEWSHESATMRALLHPPAVAADGTTTSTAAATTSAAAAAQPMPPLHAYGVGADGELVVAVLEAAAAGGKGGKAGVSATSTRTLRGGRADVASAVVATLDRAHVAVVDTSGTKLLIHAVGSGGALAAHAVPSLAPGATASLSPSLSLPASLLVRSSAGASLLLKLPSGSGAPTVARALDDATDGAHVFGAAASREGKAAVSLARLDHAAGVVQLEFLQISADGAHGEWSAPDGIAYDIAGHGRPVDAWLSVYARKDGSVGHRVLLGSEDHTLQLLLPGQEGAGRPAWERPEALATIVQSDLLPLPALATGDDAAGGGGGRPFFGFAVPSLVEGVRNRLGGAGRADAAAAGGGPPPAHADAYGLRQAVVAATAAGKVFGLHSSDGSVLWSKRVPSPTAEDDAPPALPHVFVCRGGGGPQAVVVAQGTAGWSATALNPFTGRELGAPSTGSGKIVHAARLDALAPADGSTRPPVMLVDDSLAVHFFPPASAETAQLVEARLADLFFYLFDAASGSLRGFAVTKAAGGGYGAAPRWSMALPAADALADRPPVSLASFPAAAAVHSPVRVLGDRSVLHKYVNRNLLAIGIEQPGDGDFDEPSLQLMLVDTVSGRVVYTVRYHDAVGPLTLLMGENWLVWHYWSPKQLTYQVAVAELFTNSTASDDPLTLILGGGPDYSLREHGFDGFSHAPPHVLTQGYVFAAPLSAMAVTQTVAGLTPKFVLAATKAGQLVLLDKRFLDPRRPIVPGGPQKMSQFDREEGLVPYGPSLGGISPLSVASHRHTVARPRGIVAAPTYLESTSLVLMTGLDLFCTRVAPAREFDRLGEDFNYPALVVSIVAMAAATIGSGWYATRKDLARAWK